MTGLMNKSVIGWVLRFGAVACSASEVAEQVLVESEASENPSSSESASSSSEVQSPKEDSSSSQGSRNHDDLEIVTFLPRDGTPAIDNLQFLYAEQADEEYAPDELVSGM